MAQLVVQLARDAASAAQRQGHAVLAKAASLGVTLRPVYPQSSDPALSCWLQAEVDHAHADLVAETLRGIPDVTAAYVKPRAAAPKEVPE
jgi:hypothetical protein